MKDYKQLIDTMSPEVYGKLTRAVELGKWPDGRLLTPEQRKNALQAVIAWGEEHLPARKRIGYIDKGHKEGEQCDTPEEVPLAWKG